MGWHTTVNISRSAALRLYVEHKFGEVDDRTLEKFLDGVLYDKGYNAFVVDDGTPNEDHVLDLVANTTPLLRLLDEEGGRSRTLRLADILEAGIRESAVDEAVGRGEVTRLTDGSETLVTMTDTGAATLPGQGD